jgi:hypothetical protein
LHISMFNNPAQAGKDGKHNLQKNQIKN